jgi:hypothetical protein
VAPHATADRHGDEKSPLLAKLDDPPSTLTVKSDHLAMRYDRQAAPLPADARR